jgi:hypothetical protein
MASSNDSSSAEGLDIKKVCKQSLAEKLWIDIETDSRDRQR